jgi:apolipoprotein N-acyltransferase
MPFTNPTNKENRLIWKFELDPQELRAIVLSAALFIFSYPPSPFGFLIYFAFIPQIYLYSRLAPANGFVAGYILGILVNFGVLYWIIPYSFSDYVLVAFFNSLQFAIFAALVSFALRYHRILALIAFPFLWTFLEYTRQLGEIAFNWLCISHTQTSFLALIQYVEFTGHLGIVLWICMVNLLIYLMWHVLPDLRKMALYGSILVFFFALPLSFGRIKLSEKQISSGISIGYVQPNIDPDKKWSADFRDKNMALLATLTDSLITEKPAIVLWPETAIPYDLLHQQSHLRYLNDYVTLNDIFLLTGTLDYILKEEKKMKFNATVCIEPNNDKTTVYHKILLVPFEERIPYVEFFSDLVDLEISEEYLLPGHNVVLFEFEAYTYRMRFAANDWQMIGKNREKTVLKLGNVICFESLYSNLVRRFYQSGAQVMTVITNDGWFGYTAQPYQHLQFAVFRAIENRSSIIQCANTGISGFIDPYGRVFKASTLFSSAYAQKLMPLKIKDTVYTRVGDIVGIICGIVSITFVLFFLFYKHRLNKLPVYQSHSD